MKILVAGDVVGRRGREAVLHWVPELRKQHRLDFVLVNADNAAGGFGVLPAHCEAFFDAGVDVITAGDHVWDQRDLRGFLNQESRLLRPMNFPDSVPGRGVGEYQTAKGQKVLVMHPLGQVFINDNVDCPFAAVDTTLKGYRLGATVDAILVDIHAEATSEKNAMGVFCDGRVSAVFGTHTHVPTADTRLLPGGTAYQTDLGMCGDYNSIIGFEPEAPLSIFTTKMRKTRMTPAMQTGTFCGILIETDDQTGLAKGCERLWLDVPKA